MSEVSEASERLTALIADDDDIARSLLKGVLQGSGLNVVADVADGKHALAETKRLLPDVVCLDIDMPQMNGLEVLARLRIDYTKLIVLIVTASPTAENVRAAMQAKADGVIAKPFNQTKIKNEIDRAVARKQLSK